MLNDLTRREWLKLSGAALAGAVIAVPSIRAAEADDERNEIEVTAAEDLMREHGILRRALLVYAEASTRLAGAHADLPMDALVRTAKLFRSFGEDYHERSLEEQHVFVPLKQAGGRNAALVKTLIDQHERGRQITNYIEAKARKGQLPSMDATAFAGALASFVRMYEHHAAIEDTIIFPAWKATLSAAQYDELNDRFEDLEHRMFGKDGFEDAAKQIASIEHEFGVSDLAALTAPAPPG